MVIRVEVNDFSVRKADSEAIFDKHVAFFLFPESGLATGPAALGMAVGLDKRGFIIDELDGFGELDTGTRLASKLVVCRELGALKAEEPTSPILR